jgi:hypothetical protein
MEKSFAGRTVTKKELQRWKEWKEKMQRIEEEKKIKIKVKKKKK